MVLGMFLGGVGKGLAVSKCPGSPTSSGSTSTSWTDCFGIWNSANGNKYVGEFKNGKYHGQGTFIYISGDKYVGEFKNGKRNGQGIYTSVDGHEYVGELRDNKQHGRGTLTFGPKSKWAGDIYVGEWKDGRYHGQGTYSYADESIKEGVWENGNFKYAKKVSPTVTSKDASSLETVQVRNRTLPGKINNLDQQSRAKTELAKRWGVQVGAYSQYNQAYKSARTAVDLAPRQLKKGFIEVVPLKTNRRRTLYRSRIYGLDKRVAYAACFLLERQNHPCMEINSSMNGRMADTTNKAPTPMPMKELKKASGGTVTSNAPKKISPTVIAKKLSDPSNQVQKELERLQK